MITASVLKGLSKNNAFFIETRNDVQNFALTKRRFDKNSCYVIFRNSKENYFFGCWPTNLSKWQKQSPGTVPWKMCSVKTGNNCELLKKRLWHNCFLANFLRTPVFTEQLRWLLLVFLLIETTSENLWVSEANLLIFSATKRFVGAGHHGFIEVFEVPQRSAKHFFILIATLVINHSN